MTAIVSNLSLSASRNLDRALQAILDDTARPLASLSVAAIRKGSIVYARALGNRFIDPEDTSRNKPATTETRYRVASISKVLTTIGALKLFEAGELELDRDLSDYLGWRLRNPNFPDTPITSRMLLSHTSSLRDDDGSAFPAQVWLQDVLEPDGPSFNPKIWAEQAPGFFAYTNLNFGVLATVMERITEIRFDRFIQDTVLTPLGMGGGFNPASFSNSRLKTLAVLYRKYSDGRWDVRIPWVAQVDDYAQDPPSDSGADYQIGTNGTLFSPQGGLRASPLELSRVALLLMNDGRIDDQTFLEPQTVQMMFSDQWTYDAQKVNGDHLAGPFRSWGLGLQHFRDSSDGHRGHRIIQTGGLNWFGHLGGAYGLQSGMLFDPVTKNGMVYAIGGLGANPEKDPGSYSAFSRREELIMTALYDHAIQ